MQPGSAEMLVPLIERSEFELARAAIEGFEPWATYVDYLSEREGRRIGLASAGQDARLAPVSVRAFLDWSATSATRPTLALLDRYAAMAMPTWPFPGGPQATEGPAGPSATHSRTGMAIDQASYREWLECLGEQPSDALLERYAALVVESWAEPPSRSFPVGRGVISRWLRSRLFARSSRTYRRRRSRTA
jgi:hypothetical protein